MNFKEIIASWKRHGGLSGGFRAWMRLYLGIYDQQRNIDTLNYLLNEYVDITKLAPNKDPNIRLLQLCDATLLAIFDKLCQKHGLRYWLAYGTLLGAVRHKGFIPWDDDVDISMPREDYEKALLLFPAECEKLGLEYNKHGAHPYICSGIAYNHRATGIWIDIFVVDSLKTDKSIDELFDSNAIAVEKKVREHFKSMKVKNVEEQIVYRNKLLKNDDSANQKLFYDNLEFKHFHPIFYEENDLYPLKELVFEGYSLKCPNDYKIILRRKYGDYMKFPKSGVAHHGTMTWAEKSGADMNKAYEALIKIYETM